MPLLEITDLRKAFTAPDGTAHEVVRIPRFEMDARAQVALSGPSGTGKTTFLHLIAGILVPDSGKLVLDGVEMSGLAEPARDRLRRRCRARRPHTEPPGRPPPPPARQTPPSPP